MTVISTADGEVAACAQVIRAPAGAQQAAGQNVKLRATTITSARPIARRGAVTSEANASSVTAADTAEVTVAFAISRESRRIKLRLCNVTFIANKTNPH